MALTRREFMKYVGVTLASFVLARCTPPWPQRKDTTRDRLRNCWLQLDWLGKETREHWESANETRLRDELTAEHRAALDELVSTGTLTAAVADEVQAGFSAAAYHVWRSNAPMTCYAPVLINYTPETSGDLGQQAQLLDEMAGKGGLDPNTVALAQASIERDLSFLALPHEKKEELYRQILDAYHSSIPFSEVPLEVTPEAAEAARFLVDLILGRMR